MKPDLSTRYLGLDLSGPLVASASPLTADLDLLRRLEESGASAVVLPSLFEEQIEHEAMEIQRLSEFGTDSFAEALDYLPGLDAYNTGPERMLRHVESAREALSIPVIASLNGTSKGGWVRYANLMQDAGAHALELNLYFVPTSIDMTGAQLEERLLELVAAVREAVSIPLAVKIGPAFSSPGNMCKRLVEAGADGLVLFNRFLRPDIDLEALRLVPNLSLSTPDELRRPMLWIGILRGRLQASLAGSSGVHSAADAIKLLLVGADAVLIASTLLVNGPERLLEMRADLLRWLEENEYESVEQMKGSMSRDHCPDPESYERANYMKALISFTGEHI